MLRPTNNPYKPNRTFQEPSSKNSPIETWLLALCLLAVIFMGSQALFLGWYASGW